MPAVSSQKVQTLPDDLRKIADELIADKFPEEVKRAEPRASSRGARVPTESAIRDSLVGNGRIEVIDDYATRRRIARTRVHDSTFGALLEAASLLDRNIPIRGEKRILMGGEFLRNITRDNQFYGHAQYDMAWQPREGIDNPLGQIYGMNIYVMPNGALEDICYIEQRI